MIKVRSAIVNTRLQLRVSSIVSKCIPETRNSKLGLLRLLVMGSPLEFLLVALEVKLVDPAFPAAENGGRAILLDIEHACAHFKLMAAICAFHRNTLAVTGYGLRVGETEERWRSVSVCSPKTLRSF